MATKKKEDKIENNENITTEVKNTDTKSDAKKAKNDIINKLQKLNVNELKFELQKYYINFKSGIEQDSSMIKKIRKIIARKLTQENISK